MDIQVQLLNDLLRDAVGIRHVVTAVDPDDRHIRLHLRDQVQQGGGVGGKTAGGDYTATTLQRPAHDFFGGALFEVGVDLC
jgi:hypothetical protein